MELNGSLTYYLKVTENSRYRKKCHFSLRIELCNLYGKRRGMLGSALYYPHIDIHDPMWLRSAILFWDEIQTIVPSAIANPYESEDTRICFE